MCLMILYTRMLEDKTRVKRNPICRICVLVYGIYTDWNAPKMYESVIFECVNKIIFGKIFGVFGSMLYFWGSNNNATISIIILNC